MNQSAPNLKLPCSTARSFGLISPGLVLLMLCLKCWGQGTPPVFTTQPQSQTVNTGGNVTFTATATGTAPLSYQWSFNGSPIAGATSSSLTLNNAQTSQAGTYSVQVSNAAGSVKSTGALLTVNPPAMLPSITTQPQNQTVTAGVNCQVKDA